MQADVARIDANSSSQRKRRSRPCTINTHLTLMIVLILLVGLWARASMAGSDQPCGNRQNKQKHLVTTSRSHSSLFPAYYSTAYYSTPPSPSTFCVFTPLLPTLSTESRTMATVPRATRIKTPDLDTDEQKTFEKTGLLGLHSAMSRQVDEDIARDAVENYDAEKHQTVIKGVTVSVDKQILSRHLGLTAENQGQAWTSEMVAQFLGETEEEVAKRKKGAQGIPTTHMKEQTKLMKFVAQAVCLKKDDKYLSEQVFTEAARVFQGGKCDWARLLEKAMATQMVAITQKGQKLYTCAPIWQELYQKAKGKIAEKRPRAQEKPQTSQKKPNTGVSSREQSGTSSGPKGALALLQNLRSAPSSSAHKPVEVQATLANLIGPLIQSAKQSKTPEQTQVQRVQSQGEEPERELQIMKTYDAHLEGVQPPLAILRSKPLESTNVVPFERLAVINLREEEEDKDRELEARLKASMIAINTLTFQVEHLFKSAKEGTAGSKAQKEKEEMNNKNQQLEQEVKQLKEQLNACQTENQRLTEKKKKATKKQKELKKEMAKVLQKTQKQQETASQEISKAKECTKHFNLAVLLRLLGAMSAPPEEGIHLKGEQLQAFMENTLSLIDQQSQQLLLDLKSTTRSKSSTPEEEEEEADEEEEKDDDDDDDNDDEDGDDDNQGGAGSNLPAQESEQEEEEREQRDQEGQDEGQNQEQGPYGSDNEAPPEPREGIQPEEGSKPVPTEETQKMADWYQKKEWMTNLVHKLAKEHKELKMYKEQARLEPLTQKDWMYKERLVQLKKLIKSFFKRWPEPYPTT